MDMHVAQEVQEAQNDPDVVVLCEWECIVFVGQNGQQRRDIGVFIDKGQWALHDMNTNRRLYFPRLSDALEMGKKWVRAACAPTAMAELAVA